MWRLAAMSICRFSPCARAGARTAVAGLPKAWNGNAAQIVSSSLAKRTTLFSSTPPSAQLFVPKAFSTESWASQVITSIEEIDFDPSFANNVSLVGTVGRDVELRTFQTGRVGGFSVAVNNSKGETEWFNVDVFGPLADRAAENIRKGSKVLVEGRLKASSWNDKNTGAKRTAIKIVASSLKKVRGFPPNAQQDGSFQQQPWQQQEQQQEYGGRDSQEFSPAAQQQGQLGSSSSSSAGSSGYTQKPQQQLASQEELWMQLFKEPTAWVDHRGDKADGVRSAKFPDFKKRDGSASLWVDSRGTPAWVKSELPMLGM